MFYRPKLGHMFISRPITGDVNRIISFRPNRVYPSASLRGSDLNKIRVLLAGKKEEDDYLATKCVVEQVKDYSIPL